MKIESQNGDVFQGTITGIPCQILVTSYIDEPARISGLWENSFPAEFEFEFEVYDRKGYRANWLESKLNDDIESELSEKYQEILGERRYD